jgi:hypothetical protein
MKSNASSFNLDRAVLLLAGFMILLSVALGYFVHPGFFGFTAFVGLNMMQAALTGFCPAALIFSKCGLASGCAFRAKGSNLEAS